jgi:glycosyltransferase involved in cell wall biosynthesis
MKVLYISYDGMTDALGRSQVIPYITGLAQKGHSIHVISCEKEQVLPKEREEVMQIFSRNNITWSALKFSTRPPLISKLADIWKIKREARRMNQRMLFDIVHCRSYIAALAGLELKVRNGVKFIFDMRGFWANERVEGGMWNLKNPLYRIVFNYFRKLEKQFFKQADAVISLTHNGKGVIREMYDDDIAKKTFVIPCCVDTDHFSPARISSADVAKLKHNLGIKDDDFVVSYLGSIGTWYMTGEMMDFFRELTVKYTQARFLFITGDNPQIIHRIAREHGVEKNRIIISRAPRSQVPLYLAVSAISLFFIKPVFSKKASSPTKQAEIMSMGIPLICNSGVGDTDTIFHDEKGGIVIRDFTLSEYQEAIARIDEVLLTDPAEIRAKAIELFSLRDGIEIYNRIYQTVAT